MLNVITGVLDIPTPPVTNSYESIATVTLSGTQASIDFTSIASTYKHLQIRGILNPVNAAQGRIRVGNGSIDTGNNYSIHSLYGDGASAGAQGDFSDPAVFFSRANSMSNTNPNAIIIDILDYTSVNKNKTFRILNGADNNGSGNIYFDSGAWYNSASAINTISIYPSSGNWAANSTLALYGIKG